MRFLRVLSFVLLALCSVNAYGQNECNELFAHSFGSVSASFGDMDVAKPVMQESDMALLPEVGTSISKSALRGYRNVYLKTNAVGWAMLVANVAGEVELNDRWSFALPIYYSGWDWFSSQIKSRTFAIQPEVRYWLVPGKDQQNFFVGGHVGLAYFNMALDGDYRYQDHGRNTPAYGAGVSVGYRKHICSNFGVEFSLGGGVYSVHYDKFQNKPDGLLVDSKKKVFVGIDNVSVSVYLKFKWER